jgi:hypothetical protein
VSINFVEYTFSIRFVTFVSIPTKRFVSEHFVSKSIHFVSIRFVNVSKNVGIDCKMHRCYIKLHAGFPTKQFRSGCKLNLPF